MNILAGSGVRISSFLPPVQFIFLVQLSKNLLTLLRVLEDLQDPLPQVVALGVGVVRRVQEVVDASLSGPQQRRLSASWTLENVPESFNFKLL